jgi:hypothetical protein
MIRSPVDQDSIVVLAKRGAEDVLLQERFSRRRENSNASEASASARKLLRVGWWGSLRNFQRWFIGHPRAKVPAHFTEKSWPLHN